MKAPSPAVLEGYFWLPDDSERLSGRLRIADDGGCTLELLGIFGPLPAALSGASVELATVHGLVEGGPVTLYDCFYRNRNFGFGTISRSTLHVGTAIRGAHLPPESKLRVSKLEASIGGLDEWLQISGIRAGFEYDEPNKIRAAFIRYEPPASIKLSLPEVEVGFEFAWTAPGGGYTTEAKITHRARLVVVPATEQPLDDLHRLLGRVINFLSFAADQPLSIEELWTYSASATVDTTTRVHQVPLSVFYQSVQANSDRAVKKDDMLFTYPDVAGQANEMLSQWMDQHEGLAPAFNLYFALQAGRHAYLESAFLSIAQALETLHDRTSRETLEAHDVFAKRLASIMNACPEEFKDWLGEQLAYANKPSLRMRLRRMIKPFAPHFGSSDERRKFVNRVVDTRNYLTHYDPGLEQRAAHGVEIYHLTSKLEALFQLHLLYMIGIGQERIEQLISSNQKLRYRLGLKSS